MNSTHASRTSLPTGKHNLNGTKTKSHSFGSADKKVMNITNRVIKHKSLKKKLLHHLKNAAVNSTLAHKLEVPVMNKTAHTKSGKGRGHKKSKKNKKSKSKNKKKAHLKKQLKKKIAKKLRAAAAVSNKTHVALKKNIHKLRRVNETSVVKKSKLVKHLSNKTNSTSNKTIKSRPVHQVQKVNATHQTAVNKTSVVSPPTKKKSDKKSGVKIYAIDLKPHQRRSDTISNIFRALGLITGVYLDEQGHTHLIEMPGAQVDNDKTNMLMMLD